MAILGILVTVKGDDWGDAKITAECPRKPEGCGGNVELEGGFDDDPTAMQLNWYGEIQLCSECGTAFGLTSQMRAQLISKIKSELSQHKRA